MVNYNNAKIYTIRSHHTDLIYIGSTCNELRKRFNQHKCDYKKYLKGEYYYVSSFDILKYDDAYIELYEKVKCTDRDELKLREGELIRVLNCVNKRIAGRTMKMYYEENKEKIKEWKKEYYEKNKEQLKQKRQIYEQKNKEKIKEYHRIYRQKNKEQLKEKKQIYNQKNKEKRKEYLKEYHENHKEHRRKLNKHKYICDCGNSVTLTNRSRHKKTKYHRMNIHNILNHL